MGLPTRDGDVLRRNVGKMHLVTEPEIGTYKCIVATNNRSALARPRLSVYQNALLYALHGPHAVLLEQ